MEISHLTIKKLRGLIVFTILVLVGVWRYDIVLSALQFVWGILFPFILGGAIAFVINVPMSFIERVLFTKKNVEEKVEKLEKIDEKVEEEIGEISGKKVKKRRFARPLSLILTIILVIGVILLVIFVVVPQLAITLGTLGNSIAAFIPSMQRWVGNFTNNNPDIMNIVNGLQFDYQSMPRWVMSFLGDGASNVMNSTFAVASGLISGIATFFIAFSFACYVLVQKEKLHVQVRKVMFAFIPKGKAEAFLEICSLTYKTFANFLAGQCLEAVILGSMFVVTLTLFRMPYALLIGILIAFSALIPVFGAFIGCGVGTFLILMVSPQQALLFIVIFLVLQQVEGNFIYPHVVGNSVGLPSIWVLAAVSIGASLMGVIGMLIFIPISSVVYTLFREVVYLKLKKQKIKNVTATEVETYTAEEVEAMETARQKEKQEHRETYEK